jgi:hypothetical protein
LRAWPTLLLAKTIALASLCAALCAAIVPKSDFPDPHSLALEIQRLKSRILQASSPAEMPQLPDSWRVQSDGREYSISTEPLRQAMSSPQAAAQWLDDLSTQLQAPQSASPSAQAARDRLNRILSRREFRSRSENDNAWNNAIDAISRWIRNLIGRSLAGGANSGAWRFLAWSVLLAAAFLIVWLVFRFLEARRSRAESQPGSPRESQPAELDWLAIAAAAAQSGDFRTAIQAEYWACVARLRQTGLLPADLTRTPRELLSSIPPAPEYAPFSHLTRDFERFWYAGAPVAQDDFRRASSYAEALGCRAI